MGRPGGKRPFTLGVDLVELKRARRFIANHRDRLDSFLSPVEIRYVGKGPHAARRFAIVFAAKEALFKAFGREWMGMRGFRQICIVPARRELRWTAAGDFRRETKKHADLVIKCLDRKAEVVVMCHPRTIDRKD